ncbi:kinesin-like protein [Nesidiocoris tenuis]|uniref:Kinesin-like protein n=1 Tax=Nesidiocoris tenuis TaxID=355587 RepID=A0ABN7AJ93_9HEMI|nr:kinesin-like protein [Nesidiocoris tenuis]
MSDVCGIRSGISVQIRRTDGRTHPAIVSSVNTALKSVTVEWFEKGETKGKEIEFDTIFALNANLAPPSHQNLNDANLEAHKLSRDSSTSWDEDEEEDDEDECDDESHNELLSTDGDNGNSKTKSTMSISSLPNPRTNSTKAHLPLQSKNRLSAIKTGQITSHTTINGFSLSSNNSNLSENVQTVSIKSPTQNNTMPAPQPASDINAKGRKRNNVVKEVEKLKKNREERRLRQAEKKEEKEALMNIDPGNPNWQTLAMIREYQNSLDFRPLRGFEGVETHQITVCVRKRPLNKKEVARKEVDVITVPRKDMIVVHETKNKVDLTKYLENQQFRFDYAFDDTCSNELVYHYTAKPLVKTIFEGGMATCFAYGQTGSGKTHTMGGTFSGKHQDSKKGIYAMVAKDVFKFLNSSPYQEQNLIVSASFFEIYSGKVFDLLADKAKLRVLEDGKQQVQVVGLTEKVVNSVDEVLLLITSGNAARTSGQTSANSNSSRSHAVFQITLRSPGSHRVRGKFSLIDLAGNERGADTSSADRLTRMEGAEINKSLLALKECIRALGRKGTHLPFRASKLTQVLRDSFIGDNSKTCMIAMISPGMSSCEHSLNTLRYADRVKELAATEQLEGTTSSGNSERIDCNNDSMQRDDLATLRSLNEGEISAEMYHFHEAVSHLQLLEDDVVETFTSWHEQGLREQELIDMTRRVDYDQDAFATRLDSLLDERWQHLKVLREKVKEFRHQLDAEEEISKKMKK